MTHHPDPHHPKQSSSPSKDHHHNTRKVSTVCRKYVVSLAFVAACFVVLLHSPDVSVTEMGNRTTKAQVNPIRLISLLGERNSGTRWTFDHLSECFNHSVEVRKGLTRYKHWFQYENETKYPHDTLVLVQFRNPYDWLKSMEHVPHHSPAHLRTKRGATTDDHSASNDWKIFLTKPWTTERAGADLLLFGNETCQEDFPYRDIVSCTIDPFPLSHYNYTIRYSENQPFYEMRNDGSGLPYPNILEMRTDKIRNFLSVSNYKGVADVWTMQYEYLVQAGTQHMLDRIEEWTGIAPRCKAKEPQERTRKPSRMIKPDFAAHVRQHLNWTVEGWIGYEPELKFEDEATPWRRKLRTQEKYYQQDVETDDA